MLNRKFKFLTGFFKTIEKALIYQEIIDYGIANIDAIKKIDQIEFDFRGRAKKVENNSENFNLDVWAMDHCYLGQEHLQLSFEKGRFNGVIDFDLMPDDQVKLIGGKDKRLVNFKAQIFTQGNSVDLVHLQESIFENLKKRYGLPNYFDNYHGEQKEIIEEWYAVLREQYLSMGVNKDLLFIWFIERSGIYYSMPLYFFSGNEQHPPYVSFAMTKCFSFNNETGENKSDNRQSEKKLANDDTDKEQVIVAGITIEKIYYPKLYDWARTNPDTLEEQLQSIAKAWHEGDITSAAQALESDLK